MDGINSIESVETNAANLIAVLKEAGMEPSRIVMVANVMQQTIMEKLLAEADEIDARNARNQED